MLAPINSTSNSADYDLSGFHACAQLFGLLFDVYVDFGQARYHPDAIMLPLEMAAADSIVTAGLEQKQHPGINSTSNNNSSNAALVQNFYDIATDAGFNETELNRAIDGLNITKSVNIKKRDTYYEVYASDYDKTCANCDFGLFYESTCYSHAAPFASVRASAVTCSYMAFEAWPHHDCDNGDSAVRSSWPGTMSSCIGDRSIYSWQGDCSSNACYRYIIKNLKCPGVALEAMAYYFGYFGNKDWEFSAL